MKLYIIANRLPVKVDRQPDGTLHFQRSEGGLATGLSSLETHADVHWVGWPGIHTDDPAEKAHITTELAAYGYHPVFLTKEQINLFYEGYSNSVIWPLCHYFYTYIEYEASYWEGYKAVNTLFADVVGSYLKDGDVAWVHDYQLMLLPSKLRRLKADVSIGYFHHIPFPSYELFRVLPEREDLLNGLLGADLIGFHTHDYMRHFISAVERVKGLQFNLDEVLYGNRVVHVDNFPMGINYELYNNAILQAEVQAKANALQQNFRTQKLVLSVDRLDYSKGILNRLKGFALFLDQHPAYRGQVSLIMTVVPSRDHVLRYAKLKKVIDETIGAINGRFSTLDWTPVYYFYHSLSFEELVALYYIADVALVSPLRDGMNLVAKEYIASKRDRNGVLILSEMAGAAAELSDAVIINPNDVEQISESLVKALEMPEADQRKALESMQDIVSRHTVKRWADGFLGELQSIRQLNQRNLRKRLAGSVLRRVKEAYAKADRRLLILDYDGTLSPFHARPGDAYPTPDILDMLERLIADSRNKVVISSGRDHVTLEDWLGHLPLDMAAEHGVFYKERKVWHRNLIEQQEWDGEILNILQTYVDKTPGSKLEMKETALVWHFRKVDAWLASLREQQLVNALIGPCTRHNMQIMRGNKILEIKSSVYTKGSEAKRLLKTGRYDFILAMGDDTTDEDTFRALPRSAFTIKIGSVSDEARYYLYSQSDAVPFLNSLLEA
ncbi:MAG: bifunctional alpha,alpha-trehalose-phosphate synthase (UDP-forming)/trehalose-phosphatase [Bacteroidales bacterium]|nr:bifunctional alpha,alpha-trehalose-phosphate synthase (UDP-forming)/trehalose-phosphatase [Bacteroidales bacterium]